MSEDTRLIAHLMRRAGFGATRDEIEACAAKGYDATVEEILDPPDPRWMGDFMVRRFHHEQSGMMGPWGNGDNWLYRMGYHDRPPWSRRRRCSGTAFSPPVTRR